MQHLYEQADLYEKAFSYRNIQAETEFLLSVYAACLPYEAAPNRALDIAGGAGAHACYLLSRGISVTLLDSSPAMLNLARQRAHDAGYSVATMEANMEEFDSTESFDLAICMLDSIGHIISDGGLISHLSCVSRSLKSHGIYIIELGAPNDENNISHTKDIWSVTLPTERVDVEWIVAPEFVDLEKHIRSVSVNLTGTGAQGTKSISDHFLMREWTLDAIDLCLEQVHDLARWRVYGDFNVLSSFQPGKSWRTIITLRKVS